MPLLNVDVLMIIALAVLIFILIIDKVIIPLLMLFKIRYYIVKPAFYKCSEYALEQLKKTRNKHYADALSVYYIHAKSFCQDV